MDALRGNFFFPADCVGIEGVAAINDDVALFKALSQLANDGVGAGACLDHDDGRSWLCERSNEVVDAFAGDEVCFRVVSGQLVSLLNTAVVDSDTVALTRG